MDSFLSDHEELINMLDACSLKLSQNPHDKFYLRFRSLLYHTLHAYDQAISDLEELITDNSSAAALYFRADCYLKKNDYSKAIQDYYNAVATEPKYSAELDNRADSKPDNLTVKTLSELTSIIQYEVRRLKAKYLLEKYDQPGKWFYTEPSHVNDKYTPKGKSDLLNFIEKVQDMIQSEE